MQRVRIGLTGLAFVFVLVLLTAVLTKPTDEEPITPNRIEEVATQGRGAVANDGKVEELDEPLAELGVAPGSAPDTKAPSEKTVPVEDPLRVQRRR